MDSMKDLLTAVSRAFADLRRRLNFIVQRGVVTKVVELDGIQRVELDFGDGRKVLGHRLQEYGFTSYPKTGAQAVVLNVGGMAGNPLCIVAEDGRFRILVEEGEVAMYNDDGTFVKITKDGKVRINSDLIVGGKITAEDVEADTIVGGTVSSHGKVLHTHTHSAGALISASPGSPVTGVTGAPT